MMLIVEIYGGTVGIKWVFCVFVKCHFLWLNKKRLCDFRYTKNMLKTDKNADKWSKIWIHFYIITYKMQYYMQLIKSQVVHIYNLIKITKINAKQVIMAPCAKKHTIKYTSKNNFNCNISHKSKTNEQNCEIRLVTFILCSARQDIKDHRPWNRK